MHQLAPQSSPLFEAWGLEQLAKLPRHLASVTKSKADYIFEQTQNRFAANKVIKQITDICQEKTVPADIDSSNQDIIKAGQLIAARIFQLLAIWGEDRAIKYAHEYAPREIDELLDDLDEDENKDLIIARITHERWWRNVIRKQVRQTRERAWVNAHPTRMQWASPDAITEYRGMLEGQQEWSDKHALVSDTGERISAPSPTDTALKQAAQLTAQAAGIDRLASDEGMESRLVTITLPSEYHPTTTAGGTKPRPNPKFNPKLTPRRGHAALNSAWSKTTRSIKNKGIKPYWMLGVQPHRDSSLHWHVTMWAKPQDWPTIEAAILRYFGKIHGENMSEHAIQFDKLAKAGGLTGAQYAIRAIQYITRAIAADADEDSKDAKEAIATGAWASTHGIRRFRTSHTASTLWKLSRKMDVNAPDEIKQPALNGDYATFYRNVKATGAGLLYTRKRGLWSTYKKPIGIFWANTETGEMMTAERSVNWILKPIGNEGDNAEQAESAELIQKAKGWTNEPAITPENVPFFIDNDTEPPNPSFDWVHLYRDEPIYEHDTHGQYDEWAYEAHKSEYERFKASRQRRIKAAASAKPATADLDARTVGKLAVH